MATRRLSGLTTSSSVPDNGGDHSGGGEPEGTYTDDVFSTYLYEGTQAEKDIINGIDLDGEGGLVWLKGRSGAVPHYLFDTERGENRRINSNNHNAEVLGSNTLNSFNDDGFSLGAGDVTTTGDWVSWTFRKAPNFFDCVTYTGTGIAENIDIPHNLGSVPGMIILKDASNAGAWYVWHRDYSYPLDNYQILNQTNGVEGNPGDGIWGSSGASGATSTSFSINGNGSLNTLNNTYVAYVFAHDDSDESQIKCGGISGSGSVVDVELGWEPQFVLWKESNKAGDWYITDSMRGFLATENAVTLRPNQSAAENASARIKPTSTGFTFNTGGEDYIFMAIRRPNKPRPPVGYYVDDVFSTYLYTGDDSPYRTIENEINLLDEGGLVWLKSRTDTPSHYLMDTERGPTYNLSSNNTDASLAAEYLSAFESNGFTTSQYTGANPSGKDMASWTFRKAKNFFDCVTWTGDGQTEHKIPHNLGVEPGMIIVKVLDHTWPWAVYHKEIGSGKYLVLNTDAWSEAAPNHWGSADPTDSVFTVGNNGMTNQLDKNYVAYVFAHDDHEDGYIQCGSYTGNGNNDGPEIDLGFEPQWVMIKDASASSTDWFMFDTMRNWNVANASELKANTPAEEAAVIGPYKWLRPLPNGFKITDSATGLNLSGNTHIYMAIRRPNKPASEFEPEELFAMDAWTRSYDPGYTSGFPVDMAIGKNPTATGNPSTALPYEGCPSTASRLTGTDYLLTSESLPKIDDQNIKWGHNDGWQGWEGNTNMQSWMWRRAPGFFDVVTCSTVNQGGGTHTFSHNLGVKPGMMLVKQYDSGGNWSVYHHSLGYQYRGLLNSRDQFTGPNNVDYFGAEPTDTEFTLGADWGARDRDLVVYLFASVPGISKVGSYTGNGGSQDIDCGFTNGARFVLIKCTSSGELDSNWYVWDSLRGIGSGNDPYICLNNTVSQEVSFDALDTLPAGFTIKQAGPHVNKTGEDYIYMAIA